MMMFRLLVALTLCLGVWSQEEPVFELKGRFIQVTDLHPDNHYIEGSLARTACHHFPGDEHNITSKVHPFDYDTFGSDFDPDDNRTASHFGVPDGPCDTPWALVNATFEYIDKVWKDKIDFIVWTGDNVRHDNDHHFPRSPSHIFGYNRIIRDKFYDIFKPNNSFYPLSIPIIPSYGNNDVWPHNIFAPGPNYQTRSYATLWNDMIPEYEQHTFERGGYFAVEIVPNKLAVISLNTLYWFASNAAADGCTHKSEPGSQQFEWLRVQLTEYRKRGVKAYLTGHVPAARKYYYPGCFRRYTLWTHAFRDVILGHFFGHNNLDHFFLLDAKQARQEEEEAQMLHHLMSSPSRSLDISTFNDDELEILERLAGKDMRGLEDGPGVGILGAEEYLNDVKEGFQRIPNRPKKPKQSSDGEEGKMESEKWLKKVHKWEENYQMAHVAPSIIPTYFSGIRVYEYNVTGLNQTRFKRNAHDNVDRIDWKKWWEDMDREIAEEEKTLQETSSSKGSFTIQNPRNWFSLSSSSDQSIQKKNKKKPKPHFSVPEPPGPHKSSPRGPMYEPQLFTPIRWEVHYVNLTKMNRIYDENPNHVFDYSKNFFTLEYSSDAAPFQLKDLTIGNWLDLAKDIGMEMPAKHPGRLMIEEAGEEETVKKGKGKKKPKKVKETFWDVYLKRAFVNSGHHLDFGQSSVEEGGSCWGCDEDEE